jgi:hypothetical protein
LNLTGATQTLPSLYSLGSSAATSGDFHSIAPTSTGIPWSGGGWGWSGGYGVGAEAGALPRQGPRPRAPPRILKRGLARRMARR